MQAGIDPIPSPLRGTIFLVDQSMRHKVVKVGVGTSGHFRTRLPPGTWGATGTSPKFVVIIAAPHHSYRLNDRYRCRASTPVTITSGRSTFVNVLCQGR
jgi:hypothetical protein